MEWISWKKLKLTDIFNFKIKFGLGCCWIVAGRFWKIDSTENCDLLLGTEDSGKRQPLL